MIFDKKPTEYGQARVITPIAKAGSPSSGLPPCAVIDASLNIEGDLTSDGDVQVDGHINGNVSCTHLTISNGGEISGDIKAKEIVVRGKVKGTIRATRVMLMDSAHVAGDIFYDRMSMEEGAHFVGASNKGKDETTAHVARLHQATADMTAK
jgi:cytoskeletal protein CcmA (bactofilin family)